jgi:hypothetical protein
MSLRTLPTHYFHANATGIGGYIERPFKKDIPVQSPTALSPSGGSDEASTTNFQFEKIMSARMTRTRVEGHFAGTYPTTRATAIVEDLNVLDVIRAEELVAYISTQHPGAEPNVPKIDFGLTAINGLRVGDSILRVHLDLERLTVGDRKRFPKKAPLYEKEVWERAGKKKEFDPEKGFLKCSLVEEIEVIRGKKPHLPPPPPPPPLRSCHVRFSLSAQGLPAALHQNGCDAQTNGGPTCERKERDPHGVPRSVVDFASIVS